MSSGDARFAGARNNEGRVSSRWKRARRSRRGEPVQKRRQSLTSELKRLDVVRARSRCWACTRPGFVRHAKTNVKGANGVPSVSVGESVATELRAAAKWH